MAENCDTIIIGGGPAGLAAAVYTCRAEMKTVILERGLLGGQVSLTDQVDNYAGFPEGVSGPDLIQKMEAQFGLYKKVVDMETGITFRVPIRDIIVKGLKQQELHKYPEWKIGNV